MKNLILSVATLSTLISCKMTGPAGNGNTDSGSDLADVKVGLPVTALDSLFVTNVDSNTKQDFIKNAKMDVSVQPQSSSGSSSPDPSSAIYSKNNIAAFTQQNLTGKKFKVGSSYVFQITIKYNDKIYFTTQNEGSAVKIAQPAKKGAAVPVKIVMCMASTADAAIFDSTKIGSCVSSGDSVDVSIEAQFSPDGKQPSEPPKPIEPPTPEVVPPKPPEAPKPPEVVPPKPPEAPPGDGHSGHKH